MTNIVILNNIMEIKYMIYSFSAERRKITCCFTGHRKIPASEYETIKKRLENEIIGLIEQGVRYFGAGGALGFDTMAALAVLRLKKNFPHIRLILVLPCKDQAKSWREEDIKIYGQILSRADKLVYTSENYEKGCMHKRNRHLADHSGVCLCYQTKTSGGAFYTVNYARQKGIQIINLALSEKS